MKQYNNDSVLRVKFAGHKAYELIELAEKLDLSPTRICQELISYYKENEQDLKGIFKDSQ